MLHKHSFVAFARMLLLIFALIIFKYLHKIKITNTQMFLQNFMNNNHKQNQNPTHEQTKTQNKKTIKFSLISFHNKMKMKTLKQWSLHLTSQLNNDVVAYGVGIFVAHIGHLHKIHELYNNKTYSWPKQKKNCRICNYV